MDTELATTPAVVNSDYQLAVPVKLSADQSVTLLKLGHAPYSGCGCVVCCIFLNLQGGRELNFGVKFHFKFSLYWD